MLTSGNKTKTKFKKVSGKVLFTVLRCVSYHSKLIRLILFSHYQICFFQFYMQFNMSVTQKTKKLIRVIVDNNIKIMAKNV